MHRITIVLFFLLLFFSCKKEEGLGGLASIKGTINVQNLNCILKNAGSKYAAIDMDVYIQYGDNNYINDKVETNPAGQFQFNYLTPGNYKIIIYSDDTISFKKEEIAIVKDVKIERKKGVVDLGVVLTYKHVDIDDGQAELSGVVKKFQYASGTTIIVDTIFAQDTDVFLLLEGSTACFVKEKTHYDGSFVFNNLIPGNYNLYVLSEQQFSKEDIPVFVDFSILENTSEKVLETIYISDF